MKFKDLKDLSKKEVLKKIKLLETDIFQLKQKNSLGQVANPLEIRSSRKDLARLKTALTAKLAE